MRRGRGALGRGWAVAAAVLALVPMLVFGHAARAEAALGSAQSAAFFDSEPGDWIGAGQQIDFTTVTYDGLSGGWPTFTVSDTTGDSFSVWFAGAAGTGPLAAGSTYEDAQLVDTRQAGHPGLYVFGDGRACNTADGRFMVDDATYNASGDVLTFSARFEQHCDGATPALFGAISYDSTADYRTRTISPGALNLDTSGTTPVTGDVTITDNGPSSLDPTGFDITGTNASQFAITANTCTSSLASGGSCTVSVTYTPDSSATNPETATLSFYDELAPQGSAGEPATAGTGRHILLTANRPTLTLNPPAADLGYGRVGDYVVPGTTFTLHNPGPVAASISAIDFVGGNYYDWIGQSTCGSVLAGGASCTITVNFAPTRPGTRRSSLVVYGDAVNGPQVAQLSGDGTEGYYLAGAAGEIGTGGDAVFYGDLSQIQLADPIVSITTTTNGAGYWLLGRDGGIFSFGNAHFYGSTGGVPLVKPVLAMSRTPDSRGYRLVASDGGIFCFGDARFFGSTGGVPLVKPIVGMATTPDGGGYWLVASDGGIFSFGDAHFYGSTGGVPLVKPIVGMAPTPDGKGYWLVASDGGIFAFGDATFYGSTGGVPLARPIVGMTASPTGHGYWFVASDGGVFAFGDAPFYGSLGGVGITDVIGMAATSPPLAPFFQTHSASLGADRAAAGLSGRALPGWRAVAARP